MPGLLEERPSAEGKQGVLAPKVMGERATRGHVTSGNVLSVALAPTNCTVKISDHGIKTLEPSGFLSEEISIIYYEDGTPPFLPIRRPLLRKPRMGEQILRRSPILRPPAQHSRDKVYKLGHLAVIIKLFSHGYQVLLCDKLGDVELPYLKSVSCI